MVLTWEITRACALDCVHCRAEACADRDPRELTTSEAKAVIDRVAAFEPRPPYLVFSGGEPGSFDTILEAAGHARELGLALQINSTLLEPLSADDTETFLGWLHERQRKTSYRVITVEAPHYRRIAHRAERARGNRGVRVGSTGDGKGFAFISHLGEIFPSGFLPVAAGNVRSDDLVAVYRDAPLFRELRDAGGLKGKCGICEYRTICGGARAWAWAVTGDHMEADPFCAYVPRRYERLMASGEALPPNEYFNGRRTMRLPVLES